MWRILDAQFSVEDPVPRDVCPKCRKVAMSLPETVEIHSAVVIHEPPAEEVDAETLERCAVAWGELAGDDDDDDEDERGEL